MVLDSTSSVVTSHAHSDDSSDWGSDHRNGSDYRNGSNHRNASNKKKVTFFTPKTRFQTEEENRKWQNILYKVSNKSGKIYLFIIYLVVNCLSMNICELRAKS